MSAHLGATGTLTLLELRERASRGEKLVMVTAYDHASARLAAEAGRKPPPVLGYVRTAVGRDAKERLEKEEAFYRDLHDGYRKHFDRLGAEPGTVGIATDSSYVAQAELKKWEALDIVVVRALASAKVEPMTELAAATAPGGSETEDFAR